MDPVLSTQFPVHKIGSDGFAWWVGQIESNSGDDPKNSGRYRVRIVGTHLKDCNATTSEQLPWANVMLPATTPWSDGGKTGASIGLTVGNWVIGFYLDNDKQKPIIMGSIGHTAGATLLENVENDPNPASTCKGFTTFLDQSGNPYVTKPIDNQEVRDREPTGEEEGGAVTKVSDAGLIAAAVPKKMPPAFYALFADASLTNPTGKKVCVEIANPNCGSEQNLESGLKSIIGDMLKSNQDSNGKLGDFYVSKFTGELNPVINDGRTYINKAILLVKGFIARLKGEIVKLLREAVDKLVETLLYTDAAVENAEGNINTGPVNPDLGIEPFQPVTVKVSKLKPIIDTFNDVLNEVGCSMEDLTGKIAQYITDLLFGFLMDAYSNAACLVDTAVSGIINQIISFVDSTLASILGPLIELLGAALDPANLLGNVVSKAFDLLGISCDGPNAACDKVKKVCVDCAGDSDDDDWLDDLLDQLEDGPLDNKQYVCDEAKESVPTPPNDIRFIGGIFTPSTPSSDDGGVSIAPTTSNVINYSCEDITVKEGNPAVFTITRSGNVTVSSSITVKVLPGTATENEDYIKDFDGSSVGFGPGETTKKLSFTTLTDSDISEGDETFKIVIKSKVLPEEFAFNYPDGTTFTCTIQNVNALLPDIEDILDVEDGLLIDPPPYTPPSAVKILPIELPAPIPTVIPKVPRFSVVAENAFYNEGETAVFNITSVNTTPGDIYNYSLNLDEDDIVGDLTGTFTVDNNGDATVSVGIAINNDNVRVDPPGTVPIVDGNGDFILDANGNVQFNTDEIITDIDDLNELLTLTIEETGDQGRTTILGENTLEPAYFVQAIGNTFEEGDQVCFNITTSNVPDDTEGSWSITGDVNDTTFDEGLSGTFTISDGRALVCLSINSNDIADGVRLVTFNIVDENDEVLASENVTISPDFILLPEQNLTDAPTYSVSTDKLEYKEGEVVEYTITTTNVPDGTALQYKLSGTGVSPSDFVEGKLYGSIVIVDNQAKVYIAIAEDNEVEEAEQLVFNLVGTTGFATVIVLADEEEEVPPPLLIEKPCLTKPVAGEPITDNDGSIISIPLLSKGCPYVEPPLVVIGGAGAGATAIPLLDNQGRVSEIRVTRVGSGYKKNTATDQNVKCIIDSFTIINPGRNYTSAPDVFINGQPGVAQAVIDDRGYVISVQILNRSIEFLDLPSVQFSGGGGSGARALPSIVCLDSLDDLAASGYAKIGTGRYIDCP